MADEKVSPFEAELTEALENCLASLDTVMAHYGRYMPPGDQQQRERVLRLATAVVVKARMREAAMSDFPKSQTSDEE